MNRIASAFVVLGLLLVACGGDGGDGFEPTVDSVAGTYTAKTFTATTSEGTTDIRLIGGSLTATLAPDGTTTGRLFVPGGEEDGSDLDADLTGTWTLDGNSVTFNQSADTFIRNVEFVAGRNSLTASGLFRDVSVRVVLTKDG